MNKIILSSLVVIVASLIVACSNEYTVKDRDVIKATEVLKTNNQSSKTLVTSGTKTVKLPIYILENNENVIKYLEINNNESIENKINIIADTMSTLCFNNLPIEVKVEDNKANVNLLESEYSRKTWKDDFLNEYNFEDTTLIIVKNLLQEDYEGEWINTVQIAYEGEDID